MAENKYTGETSITIGDKELTMVFDFRALARIHTTHGADSIKKFFDRNDVWQQSPAIIADYVHIGLQRKHPDISLDEVLDGLPPYVDTIARLSKALVYAYCGADYDEKREENSASDAEQSKKN